MHKLSDQSFLSKTSKQHFIYYSDETIEEQVHGVLELAKNKASEFTFDDGVILRLKETQPGHVQFFCKTT